MRNSARSLRLVFALVAVFSYSSALASGRPITVTDLLSMQRVSDPQLSPDGSRAVYTVAVPDLAGNKLDRFIWIVSMKTGERRALTSSGKDSGARFSPDGRRVAFVSSRGESAQVYVLDVDGNGEPIKLTNLPGGADNIVWSPDGQMIAFTSEVYPECRDEACDRHRDEEREKSPSRARSYDRLLYRHWTAWSEGKRLHLFVVPASGGTPRDLTPGADYDVPPREREGPHPIAFAPDSKLICFTAVTDRVEATSTNGDLFEVNVAGGTAPARLTMNPGFDGAPAYSPDGRTIAYRSQARAGYEADKWRLMLYDRAAGKHTSLIDGFDRSVESLLWAGNGKSIYFNAEDRGEMPLFMVATTGGTPRPIAPGSYVSEFDARGESIVIARNGLEAPTELYKLENGSLHPLTRHNHDLLSSLDLAKPDSFTFAGAAGDQVQGFLVRPPGFDPSKKYPVLMLLHGGPQTQWSDAWSYRWNAQMFASPGYVVVMINRRGSTGFGQPFTDQIALDWGGKPFEDLVKGLDFVTSRYAFADGQRVAAAGASYGGYMIDWLASHSKGRFRALVSHAGVYNLTSMYGATEELWFPERDFGGVPWTATGTYEKLSPHTYAAEFGKYKTPTLVIAGEQDYRVPYTQSLEFFTALQRQEVPSRLVVFPDEGHWILKLQNSRLWYSEVLGWLEKYLGK